MNTMVLVAVFETCRQGEKKTVRFSSVQDSNLNKVVDLFIVRSFDGTI